MHEAYRKIKFLLGCVLRPRFTYLRFKERRRARDKHTHHPDIDLKNLPPVTITLVRDSDEHKKKLLKLFRNNPSPLVLTPWNMKYLEIELQKGIEYYLITNNMDELVGVLGYKPEENMPGRLIIEYDHRGKGFGISAMKELEKIKHGEGMQEFWGQVYKDNVRMLNLMLSLGYKFVENRETPEYYMMVKSLSDEVDDNSQLE